MPGGCLGFLPLTLGFHAKNLKVCFEVFEGYIICFGGVGGDRLPKLFENSGEIGKFWPPQMAYLKGIFQNYNAFI